MTEAITRRYGWIRDLPDHRDYRFTPTIKAYELPTVVDMRNLDSPIRDQGQLGSCTAFEIEGAFHFEVKKQGLADYLGSPLFIYYNERADQGTVASDSGASIRESVKTCVDKGVASEGIWPYYIGNFTVKPTAPAYSEAANHKVTQYLSVAQDMTSMRQCLADGYPFVFGFTVYSNFESSETASTGIVGMPQGGVLGGHAMMAVGYNDAKQWFICRNSWGTGFGDRGYVYMPYAYLANPRLAADFWTLRVVSGAPAPTPTPTPTPTPVVFKTHQLDVFSDGSVKVII